MTRESSYYILDFVLMICQGLCNTAGNVGLETFFLLCKRTSLFDGGFQLFYT